MLGIRNCLVLVASLALVTGCDSGSGEGEVVEPTTVSTSAQSPMAEPSASESAAIQPAIWPAGDVLFTTPEEAATDFLDAVFGTGPLIGEFQEGDSRSGEIEVFASADGAQIGSARSLLLLRQLGPDGGWFVMSAVSELVAISTPEAAASVPAGSLPVAGTGTGFEGTIVVSAFSAGDAGNEFDQVVTIAGNFGDVQPYSVELDLGSAAPGDLVTLLVRGGTGLETDPGDFAAIPVVIG